MDSFPHSHLAVLASLSLTCGCASFPSLTFGCTVPSSPHSHFAVLASPHLHLAVIASPHSYLAVQPLLEVFSCYGVCFHIK